MRTTIVLDEDVFAAASHISKASGQRLGKVISDLARQSLSPEPPVRVVQDGRFPAFAPPEGTETIDPEQAQRIMDEEGF